MQLSIGGARPMSDNQSTREDLPLFRQEVIDHRAARRIFGTVSLAPPKLLQHLGLGVFCAGVGFVLLLAFGRYSVTVAAEGQVVPHLGYTRIEAPEDMSVVELPVSQGQRVSRGDLVMRLATPPNASAVASSPAQEQFVALRRERDSVLEQLQAIETRLERSESNIRAELLALRVQLQATEDETKLLEESIEVGESLFQAVEQLEDQRLVSRFEVDARRQDLISRRITWSAKLREHVALEAAIARKEADLLLHSQTTIEALAPTRQRLEELRRLETDIRAGSTLTVHSPIDGSVSLLRIRLGQSVKARTLLVVLLPEGNAVEVEAFVPAAQARKVREGQRVRLSFAQFPVGQFGAAYGEVIDVPSIAVRREDVLPGGDVGEEGFLVRISLNDSLPLSDDATRQPSLGTSAVATIIVDRQSLASLLVGPLKEATSRIF